MMAGTCLFDCEAFHFRAPTSDSLEPEADSRVDLLSQFTLWMGGLCDCSLECEIPVPIVLTNETIDGILRMHLELGAPGAPNGGLHKELLSLSVDLKGQVYRSAGARGFFENELLSLQSTFLRRAI